MVDLNAEKSVLQVYTRKGLNVDDNDNPITINGRKIPFSDLAEHVGVMRAVSGNSPTILARLSAHRRALAAVLHTGIARGHRGNPSLSIRIEKMYATPVLLSGITTLVLTKNDFDMVENHYQDTIRNLLRLHQKTPRCVIFFLAGSLPASALIHIRQLSLFGMICRLKKQYPA